MSVFDKGPWKMKPKEFEGYTSITESNRKNAVAMGRVLYVIEVAGRIIQYNGYFVVRPRLTKGELKVQNHPLMTDQNYFIRDDEDYNEWKNSFDKLISLQISKRQLFFKLSDPLVKYIKS